MLHLGVRPGVLHEYVTFAVCPGVHLEHIVSPLSNHLLRLGGMFSSIGESRMLRMMKKGSSEALGGQVDLVRHPPSQKNTLWSPLFDVLLVRMQSDLNSGWAFIHLWIKIAYE